jgi:hypothetical protein
MWAEHADYIYRINAEISKVCSFIYYTVNHYFVIACKLMFISKQGAKNLQVYIYMADILYHMQ